jgi:hypothetical protein
VHAKLRAKEPKSGAFAAPRATLKSNRRDPDRQITKSRRKTEDAMRSVERNGRRNASPSEGSRSKRAPKWSGNWPKGDALHRSRTPAEKPPTRRQIGNIRSLAKRLGRRRRWLHNRAEATYYFGELRAELNKREARAERERNTDQWSLPAAETQLSELRRLGILFTEPLTRGEANDLIDSAPATPQQLFELRRLDADFTEPLTRREARESMNNARREQGKAPT